MRILVTIPHYYSAPVDGEKAKHGSSRATAEVRAKALRECVYGLHQTFGTSQAMIRHQDRRTIAANKDHRHEIHVVIVVKGDKHLLGEVKFGAEIANTFSVDDDPKRIGFYCHQILRDRWGNYEYYAFMEDDLIVSDPWLFQKLRWFNDHVGDQKVLLPNRYERAENLVYKKCYLDGDLREETSKRFQDVSQQPELSSTVLGKSIRFVRPLNPHSGCFFLNKNQMQTWINQPFFGDRDCSFVGPLESAASLGVMKTFQVYKPAIENANFLEIEHHGSQFLSLVRKPESQ